MVFETSAEFTVGDDSFLIVNRIEKPSNIHELSTQISSYKQQEFKHESDDRHSLKHGASCWLVDWLGTHNSRYWHKILQYFMIKFPFHKPVNTEMKSLPANLPFCICLLLRSSNYCKLWKSVFPTGNRTNMLKYRDWWRIFLKFKPK